MRLGNSDPCSSLVNFPANAKLLLPHLHEPPDMKWFVAAPFISQSSGTWLAPFLPSGRHILEMIPARYVHDRSRANSSVSEWVDYFSHGFEAWSSRSRSSDKAGIITAFPQLALTVGLRKRAALRQRRTPLVAYNFNLGQLYGGKKQRIAKLALDAVDVFVVHSRRESERYSQWLSLPPERFRFVPLQVPMLACTHGENQEEPFVLAMGSAHRDYRLLLEAMKNLHYPTKIVAGEHALQGLELPSNVSVYSNLTREQCHELSQRARVNVIPIANNSTASGQVTLIEAMGLGRAVVATACPGTEDYAQSGKNAILVMPGHLQQLSDAIADLWENEDLRQRLGHSARTHAREHFSDEAAGRYLEVILDDQAARTR